MTLIAIDKKAWWTQTSWAWMDKYCLSNETQAAKDDSSALYHMVLCGSEAALGGGGSHREALWKALSFVAGFQTQWLCSPREYNQRYQRDNNEKFHFQSSGSICTTLVKSNCINLAHIQSTWMNLLSAVHNGLHGDGTHRKDGTGDDTVPISRVRFKPAMLLLHGRCVLAHWPTTASLVGFI